MTVHVERKQGLHVCPECASELVQPEWWEEAEGLAWRVGLRCPECEHRHEGTYAQAAVDAFDERLNDGSDELLAAYRRVLRENLAEELERFSGALHAGAILPEDF
jgi:DNA-directed RNA polymerase subunit RPC12/RpoP